jgi:hypothetical protein
MISKPTYPTLREEIDWVISSTLLGDPRPNPRLIYEKLYLLYMLQELGKLYIKAQDEATN